MSYEVIRRKREATEASIQNAERERNKARRGTAVKGALGVGAAAPVAWARLDPKGFEKAMSGVVDAAGDAAGSIVETGAEAAADAGISISIENPIMANPGVQYFQDNLTGGNLAEYNQEFYSSGQGVDFVNYMTDPVRTELQEFVQPAGQDAAQAAGELVPDAEGVVTGLVEGEGVFAENLELVGPNSPISPELAGDFTEATIDHAGGGFIEGFSGGTATTAAEGETLSIADTVTNAGVEAGGLAAGGLLIGAGALGISALMSARKAKKQENLRRELQDVGV